MNVHPTVALLYAQTTLAAKAANETTASFATQPEIARQLATELANLQRQQVQNAQRGDSSGKLASDGGGQGGAHYFGSRRRHRTQPPPEETETPPPNALLGNLLNLKV